MKAESDRDTLHALAAASPDNGRIAILIANHGTPGGFIPYAIEGLPDGAEYRYEIYLTDKHRHLDKVAEGVAATPATPSPLYLYQHAFAVILLTRHPSSL